MAGKKISELTALGGTYAATDLFEISKDTGGGSFASRKITGAELTSSIGAGTVTSVGVSGGTTGLTVTGSPITTSGTITIGGALVAANGGTGQTSYSTGDLLYASGATTLAKLAVGSNTEVLTLAGGVPTWAAPAGGGATDLDGLTDVSILGSGVNWSLFKNGATPSGAPTTGSFSGNRNIAFVSKALESITSGSDNVSLGYRAGAVLTTGANNFYVGKDAGYSNNGSNNVVFGNTAMGAGYATTASENIGMGLQALWKLDDGAGNLALGRQSGRNMTTGDYNILLGHSDSSGTFTTTGSRNIILGYRMGAVSTSASDTFIVGTGTGNKTLLSGEMGSANACKLGINLGDDGADPGPSPNSPSATLHVKGEGATYVTTSLLIEDSAGAQLMKLTDAGDNICIGKTAGDSITGGGGVGNVCIGKNAGTAITSADYNIIIGDDARCSATSGGNIVLGQYAGDTTMGVHNVVLGGYAGFNLNAGGHNIFLGYWAGLACTSGDKNISIGRESNVLNTGDNQIALGYGIITTATDQINIGGNIIGSMTAADRYTTFIGQAYSPTSALVSSASITPNFTNGNTFKVTLQHNTALANPTNPKEGATYTIIVTQDGTGSRTMSFGANYKWVGGTAPTLSTAGNAVDILTFISDGTNMYGTSNLNFS
jgi:hypothetical protein